MIYDLGIGTHARTLTSFAVFCGGAIPPGTAVTILTPYAPPGPLVCSADDCDRYGSLLMLFSAAIRLHGGHRFMASSLGAIFSSRRFATKKG